MFLQNTRQLQVYCIWSLWTVSLLEIQEIIYRDATDTIKIYTSI